MDSKNHNLVSPTETMTNVTKPQLSQVNNNVPSTTSVVHSQVTTVSSPSSVVTVPLTSPPTTLLTQNQSSYPAVLGGRANSTVSCETKSKVPPPVPPRGTPKSRRGGSVDFSGGKGANLIPSWAPAACFRIFIYFVSIATNY